MFFIDLNKEYKEIRVICILRFVGLIVDLGYNSGIKFFNLFGIELNIIDCNIEDIDNVNFCIDISNLIGNKSVYFISLFECGGWLVVVLYCFCFVYLVVFVYYFLVLFCFLLLIEVIEDGVCVIILEGVSKCLKCDRKLFFF